MVTVGSVIGGVEVSPVGSSSEEHALATTIRSARSTARGILDVGYVIPDVVCTITEANAYDPRP
jgi:hypothetical protein